MSKLNKVFVINIIDVVGRCLKKIARSLRIRRQPVYYIFLEDVQKGLDMNYVFITMADAKVMDGFFKGLNLAYEGCIGCTGRAYFRPILQGPQKNGYQVCVDFWSRSLSLQCIIPYDGVCDRIPVSRTPSLEDGLAQAVHKYDAWWGQQVFPMHADGTGETLGAQLCRMAKAGDLTELLKCLGQNPSKNDCTEALHGAAHSGHLACVHALIPVSNPHSNNCGALVRASRNGHGPCVDALVPVSNFDHLSLSQMLCLEDASTSELVSELLEKTKRHRAHQAALDMQLRLDAVTGSGNASAAVRGRL